MSINLSYHNVFVMLNFYTIEIFKFTFTGAVTVKKCIGCKWFWMLLIENDWITEQICDLWKIQKFKVFYLEESI